MGPTFISGGPQLSVPQNHMYAHQVEGLWECCQWCWSCLVCPVLVFQTFGTLFTVWQLYNKGVCAKIAVQILQEKKFKGEDETKKQLGENSDNYNNSSLYTEVSSEDWFFEGCSWFFSLWRVWESSQSELSHHSVDLVTSLLLQNSSSSSIHYVTWII